MPDLLVSVTAGAGGGILVVLGERFLFSAPSAWHGVKKSFRFYRQKYQEARGHYVISCPRCWRPDPDLVGNPALLPEGWEDAPRGVKWLRCSDCKHVWGIQEVVTWIGPAEDREDDGE
jgi:hypothetical protein